MAVSYKADDGTSLRLGKELGRGGEGTVHAVEGQPAHCAKIYADGLADAHLHDKLRVMVSHPPKDPTAESQHHHSIAWPVRLLYRGSADPAHLAGFVMPVIGADHDFRKAICRFHPDDRRRHFGGDFTWFHAYTAAMNISSAVAAIHERGYCIGDINESNILVAGNTLVTLIDCDSFQIRDAQTGRVFRCVVGKGEYAAPELRGKAYGDMDRTPASDGFGLAVLLFQFLMEGCHPYQARGRLVESAPSTDEKIALGHFPYAHPGKPRGVEPPAYAPPFEILHPELQRLFVRAFADGHKDPSARPTSKEWFDGLRKARGQIIECGANKNHRHFSHLGACPWCSMRKDKGRDPYLQPGQREAKPLPRPAAPRQAPARPAAGRLALPALPVTLNLPQKPESKARIGRYVLAALGFGGLTWLVMYLAFAPAAPTAASSRVAQFEGIESPTPAPESSPAPEKAAADARADAPELSPTEVLDKAVSLMAAADFPESWISSGIDRDKLFLRGRELETQGHLISAYAAYMAAEKLGNRDASERKVSLNKRLSDEDLRVALKVYDKALEPSMRTIFY